MSYASRKIPGVVELTRKTTQNTHLMRPGRDTRELTGYMFGRALLESNLTAHAACMMPNVSRTVATDPLRGRSNFMRDFHSNLARKRNLQLGRGENLWKAGKPGDTVLLDVDEFVDRTLATFLEPVARGCVDRVEDWTGFQILPRHWGLPMKFERPDLCGAKMPEAVEFVPMPPPGFEHLPINQVIDFFERRIAEEEERYRKKRKFEPLGIAYWEAMNPLSSPDSRADGTMKVPRFSASDPVLLRNAIKCEREFRRDHRHAMIEFKRGHRDVRFPSGTFQMVRIAGVATHPIMRGDPHHPRLTWSAQLAATWARLR